MTVLCSLAELIDLEIFHEFEHVCFKKGKQFLMQLHK